MIVNVVLFLKFFLPALFPFFPFPAAIANFILDTADGDILMHYGLSPERYQTWDKAADYWAYIMMLIVGLSWGIRNEIIITFAIRTIGQVLFFLFKNDIVFFLFPNFLEPLFIIYAFLLMLDKSKAYSRYKQYFWPIWIGIFVYKMWNEYNTHVVHNDLSSRIFGFNN